MTAASNAPDSSGRRRAKKFLSPSAKYELWLRLVRGEASISSAAAEAGVDRSTVIRIRQVAKEGAMSETVKELAVKLMLLEGKGGRV